MFRPSFRSPLTRGTYRGPTPGRARPGGTSARACARSRACAGRAGGRSRPGTTRCARGSARSARRSATVRAIACQRRANRWRSSPHSSRSASYAARRRRRWRAGRVLDVAQPLHVARQHARGQVALDRALGLARAARERLTLDGVLEALRQFPLDGGRVRHYLPFLRSRRRRAASRRRDAAARDFAISSFDGTRIEAHFFPARRVPGSKAPTMLVRPGLGQRRAHTNDEQRRDRGRRHHRRRHRSAARATTSSRGTRAGSAARAARRSGTHPHYEARDVQALIDALARLPEAKLDEPGRPARRHGRRELRRRHPVGHRRDRQPRGRDHARSSRGTRSSRASTRTASSRPAGAASCAGGQRRAAPRPGQPRRRPGRLDGRPHVLDLPERAGDRAALDGDRDWLEDRGPGDDVDGPRPHARADPAGTVDTLFTLEEAIDNFRVLRSNGVPTRMMWFCGGHGICQHRAGRRGLLRGAPSCAGSPAT